MSRILESESLRLAEQDRLDQLKTAKERNKWGQFATPPALALEIAQYAWARLKCPEATFSFLEPALGTGAFYGAFLQAFPNERIDSATGIELDPAFADAAKSIWSSHGLRVIESDFTRQNAERLHNVILTNPPYVRHHHMDGEAKERLGRLVYSATGRRLSGLAGLYCYFLLIAHRWLADNGLAIWLIPSEFMGVNYGGEVKRYLTEQVTLIHIHRFCPSDVQFGDALVSSAIVVFEKRRPESDHEVVFSFGGPLTNPSSTERVSIDRLRQIEKWTSLPERGAPRQQPNAVLLGDLFTVTRGVVTGNNDFFVVPRAKLQELGIPPNCVRPILPSPRFLKQEIVDGDAEGWPILNEPLALIDTQMSEEELQANYPRFWQYIQEGKRLGIDSGYLTSRRNPWYSQEKRQVASFVCTYMGRSLERPFRFIWNKSGAIAANVYLLLYPKDWIAKEVTTKAAEVFESLRRIEAHDFFSEGRVYGGGLLKMEPSELMRLPADDLANILGVKPQRQLTLF